MESGLIILINRGDTATSAGPRQTNPRESDQTLGAARGS